MIKELQVNHLILIEKARVQFTSGFNAITGETGAGKSLFLSALKLLSGHKAPPNLIRDGNEKASTEATFLLDPKKHTKVYQILEQIEIEPEDELVISRVILPGGKSKARINGTLVNVKDLQKLGQVLIQLHGQSEQVLLRDTSTHVNLLDSLAQQEDTLKNYQLCYRELVSFQKKLNELEQERSLYESQQDFFRFQFEELEKAQLKDHEDSQLEDELRQLEAAGEITQIRDGGLDVLSDSDHAVQPQLSQLILTLEPFNSFHSVKEAITALREALPNIEEASYQLRRLEIPEAASPFELDTKNSRLALLQRLKRKFNSDMPGLIELREERREQIQLVDNFDLKRQDIEFEKKQVIQKMHDFAHKLHLNRLASAQELDDKVSNILSQLGMSSAKFQTHIEFPEEIKEDDLHSRGADQIEFRVRTNQGSSFQSLKKGISGGELSRVMLALKSALAEKDQTPTLLFDEVDAGISGEVGHAIGECMQQLGEYHQVLCITHLHQVAVQANQQLTVSKSDIAGQTLTEINNLNDQTRVEEIARMLGGAKDPNWLEQAHRLLKDGPKSVTI